MSFRVILQQYLADMRERDELDLLLPELLVAMGHTVLSRPQRGSRQAGVDCLSEIRTAHGRAAYLFIIKQGDVDRKEFFASPNGIEPSVREAKTDYIRTRLPQHFEQARKHIILVSNGRMTEVANISFASLTKEVSEQSLCDLDFWGDDKLAECIEEHLLNDALILGDGRSHLRKAIATIDGPAIAIGHMAKFFGGIVRTQPDKPALAVKTFLKRCSAAMVGWVVFTSWCRSEDNLKPAVVTGEHLLLSLWSSAQRCGHHEHSDFVVRHDQVLKLYVGLLLEYYQKVLPQLLNVRAIRRYRPERMPYMSLVFDEMGRLATLLLVLAALQNNEDLQLEVGKGLASLFEVHTGCLLPYFDGQSIDLSLALAAFISIGATQPTTTITEGASGRLRKALELDKWLPIDSDSYEDALTVELKEAATSREFFQVTTLVPLLATVSAVIADERVLDFLRAQVLPQLRAVNLERWFPKSTLETSWGTAMSSFDVGGLARWSLDASCEAEASSAVDLPAGACPPGAFEVVRCGRSWLLAMSARYYRHPLPPWYFTECLGVVKGATVRSGKATTMTCDPVGPEPNRTRSSQRQRITGSLI